VRNLDGRVAARRITDELAEQVAGLAADGIIPTMAMVLVGNDPSAEAYARSLERRTASIGAGMRIERLAADADAAEAVDLVGALRDVPDVDGILLQAPMPPGFDRGSLAELVPPEKDIDGSSSESLGRLLLGRECHRPATAAAVVEILDEHQIEVGGQRVVILGRSATVGKPVALLLLARDATVTVCHSRTLDLAAVTRAADVLVVAIGRPGLVGAAYVKPGAVVVDVGINELDGKLVGDVDAEAVEPVAGALTPVPGGVGPLTTALLLSNLVTAAGRRARSSPPGAGGNRGEVQGSHAPPSSGPPG
jgi:methylenetetrahydrofolate dehydrogenase (NADP+)/methenyltetrahydrofolate cyclohydrolase